MGAPAVPPVIPIPWATNNPSLTNTIPPTTSTAGLASWSQGFPADTMQPVVAGGVPPFGQDMNGVEFALSSHDYYVQAGELYPYQAAVSTAIGGYGQGCLLGSATDPNVVWFNTIANNTTNPDATDGSAVGWVSLWAYGFATPAAMTGAAPVSLTNLQASRKFIVFTGALAGNQLVSLPANILKDWLIINNQTGAFTLTLQTSAAGSAGVTVPQGGFSNPLGVYSDGTNVYPTVTPLGVPISTGPTASTLAERDNTGQLIATFFQGTSGFENPASQPPQGVIGLGPDDATFRKYHIADMEAAMALNFMGGQVTAGQVPLAAVIQYAASILTNAALTGSPTAPTAANGSRNTLVANTTFVNPAANLVTPKGSFKLANGVIVNYGFTTVAGTGQTLDVAVTFDTPYTTRFLFGGCTTQRNVAGNGQALNGSGFVSNTALGGMTITIDSITSGPGAGTAAGWWFSLGV